MAMSAAGDIASMSPMIAGSQADWTGVRFQTETLPEKPPYSRFHLIAEETTIFIFKSTLLTNCCVSYVAEYTAVKAYLSSWSFLPRRCTELEGMELHFVEISGSTTRE